MIGDLKAKGELIDATKATLKEKFPNGEIQLFKNGWTGKYAIVIPTDDCGSNVALTDWTNNFKALYYYACGLALSQDVKTLIDYYNNPKTAQA